MENRKHGGCFLSGAAARTGVLKKFIIEHLIENIRVSYEWKLRKFENR